MMCVYVCEVVAATVKGVGVIHRERARELHNNSQRQTDRERERGDSTERQTQRCDQRGRDKRKESKLQRVIVLSSVCNVLFLCLRE